MSMPYDIEAMATEIHHLIADPDKVRDYLLDEIRDIKKLLVALCKSDAKLTGEALEAVRAHIPRTRELLALVTAVELILTDEVPPALVQILSSYIELKGNPS